MRDKQTIAAALGAVQDNIEYQNGLIAQVAALAGELSTPSAPLAGGYDVNSIANDDGSQTIEITDSASISDGLVVKARGTDGYAAEVDLYCADGKIHDYQFCSGNNNNAIHPSTFYKITKLHIKNAVTSIGQMAFAWLTSLSQLDIGFENVTSIAGLAFLGCSALSEEITLSSLTQNNLAQGAFQNCGITGCYAPLLTSVPNNVFSGCTALKSVSFPKATRVGSYTARCFMNCTALQTAEFGSVGNPVTGKSDNSGSPFAGCIQSNLTITAYVMGDFVDALLANFRNGATNATIVLKAAGNTTYNGAAFTAGETIVTSTVEVST